MVVVVLQTIPRPGKVTILRLQSSLCLSSTAAPPLSVTILFIYHTIKKTIQKTRLYYTGQLRTIRETRLYKFICVAYIQSLWVANAPNGKLPMNENLDLSY